jgi:hypothetical protein
VSEFGEGCAVDMDLDTSSEPSRLQRQCALLGMLRGVAVSIRPVALWPGPS